MGVPKIHKIHSWYVNKKPRCSVIGNFPIIIALPAKFILTFPTVSRYIIQVLLIKVGCLGPTQNRNYYLDELTKGKKPGKVRTVLE